MSVTNIFIGRHGETEYNRQGKMQGRGIDIPLNKTGRLQARAIADTLHNEHIDHIFSSSLVRSMETAEIIAWTLRMSYRSYAELDEMDFGNLEGLTAGNITNELNRLHETWKDGNTDFAVDGGESPEMVLERVLSRLQIILEEHQGSTMLFILHGRLIRILLSDWLGYGLAEMHRIEHSNGALYHLQLNGETIKQGYLNRTDHLKNINAEQE